MIVGEEEAKTDLLTIKNNITKEEYKVNLNELVEFLDDKLDECSCGCGDECTCGDNCTCTDCKCHGEEE